MTEEYIVFLVIPAAGSSLLSSRGRIRLSKRYRGSKEIFLEASSSSSWENPAVVSERFTQFSVPTVVRYMPVGAVRRSRMAAAPAAERSRRLRTVISGAEE